MAEKKLYTVTLTLPDGTRKYFRGKTKKEAERKRNEARMKVGMGVDINCATTVEELATTWFDLYKKGKLHKRSEETIEGTLRRYILPVLGKMKVADVKPIHIQQLMTSVKDLSNATQRKVLQYTKSIFQVAEENGMVSRTPVGKSIKAGGAPAKEKVPLSREQTDSLLASLEGNRAHLLVSVLLNTGLRIGEALGLMWSDIDFLAGTVTVNRSIIYPAENRRGEINTDLKTMNSKRTIPITWALRDELKKAMGESNSVWVFAMQDGSFVSYSSFRSMWSSVERRATDFKVHPHLLRHTCITRWFEQGLDIKEIQYLAGHASLDITLGVYTHYLKEERFAETAAKIRAV